MDLHELIYTDKGVSRYYRHIAFWLARYLFLLTAFKMSGYLLYDSPVLNVPNALLHNFLNMCCEMIYTYSITYYILPQCLCKKKYVHFGALFVFFSLLTIFAMFLVDLHFSIRPGGPDTSFISLWGIFWGYMGYGPPSVCGLFLVIKALKVYNKKIDEREALIRENGDAESMLLKAQVHPHFLFNTLNNIYSFALDKSAYAAELVENLSGTMRYMIKDCEAAQVPLEKELKMIKDYLQLEKVRYGDRLVLHMEIKGSCKGKMIDPLLMVPLIENCFKHGASQLLGESWIKLYIFIGEAQLQVELSNNKPPLPVQSNKKGIGLNNVRKRLRLLHPGNHSLEIAAAAETFTVYMQVPLRATHPKPFFHAEH